MAKIGTKDIAREIAKRTGYGVNDVYEIVKHVFPVIVDFLLRDNEVMIKEFGKFRMMKRPPRICTDARTGKPTMTSFTACIKFKQSVKMGPKLSVLANPENDWGDDWEDNLF